MAEAKMFELAGASEPRTEVLDARLFDAAVNEDLLYRVVRMQMANRRQGTHATKTRGEVRGGGRKPWRQKGTGRARIGSTRVPHWTGGGVTFAPKPRDMGKNIPKKMKRLALRSALSSRAAEDKIRVVEDFELSKVSTKEMATLLSAIGIDGERTLLVIREGSRELFLSARNIPYLSVTLARELTTYDILRAETIVMTQSALGTAEEVFGE